MTWVQKCWPDAFQLCEMTLRAVPLVTLVTLALRPDSQRSTGGGTSLLWLISFWFASFSPPSVSVTFMTPPGELPARLTCS